LNETDFRHNIRGAEQFARFSGWTDQEYWLGYQRGMRRHYHGEKSGTAEEHTLWMSLTDDRLDQVRRYRGLGYRAGFAGMSISDAIQDLAKFTAAAAAGSVRSEAKTQAARENARHPRPNAQGKPKPHKSK
jgi:hypothetical protein